MIVINLYIQNIHILDILNVILPSSLGVFLIYLFSSRQKMIKKWKIDLFKKINSFSKFEYIDSESFYINLILICNNLQETLENNKYTLNEKKNFFENYYDDLNKIIKSMGKVMYNSSFPNMVKYEITNLVRDLLEPTEKIFLLLKVKEFNQDVINSLKNCTLEILEIITTSYSIYLQFTDEFIGIWSNFIADSIKIYKNKRDYFLIVL